VNLNEVQKDLQQLEEAANLLNEKLRILSQIIKYTFDMIKTCESVDSAQKYFDVLDIIQSSLASLVHNQDINMPERLWRFMRDFDNFEEAKLFYFEKIKNGEYVF
jgi:hypothetical protein